jgi:hypothetical protein
MVEQEFPVVVEASMFTVAPSHASVAVGCVKFGVAVHSMVALVPALPIVGACVSTTVITCVRVAEWFPHASVASHVRVIIVEQGPVVVVDVNKFTVAPLHASDAVSCVKLGVAVHSMVALLPARPIVGACVSITVMTWLAVAL